LLLKEDSAAILKEELNTFDVIITEDLIYTYKVIVYNYISSKCNLFKLLNIIITLLFRPMKRRKQRNGQL